MINILGGVAAVISFVLFVPQAVATWRNRRNSQALAAMSVSTQLLIVANATIWLIYAYLTAAFWVGAPGLVNGPLAIMTIWLVVHARQDNKKPKETHPTCPNCGWSDPRPHRLFITTPPGYGSLSECTPENAIFGVPVPAEPAQAIL